mgnify:CR=1 FL=1
MTNNTIVIPNSDAVIVSYPTESLRWLSPKGGIWRAAPKLQQAYRIVMGDMSQKFEWRDVPIFEEE